MAAQQQTRQYGEPRDSPTPFQEVEQVLIDAGFAPGRTHRGSGWSDWDLVYEPPVPGYLIELATDYDAPGEPSYIVVKHSGRGAKEALDRYARALQERQAIQLWSAH